MATRGPTKPIDPKSIADPVERARAIRASRQSHPNSKGTTTTTPASASRTSSGTSGPGSPRSAQTARPMSSSGGAMDRTAGARKRRDHLAPKKQGVDSKLATFQAASRTVKRRPSGDCTGGGSGGVGEDGELLSGCESGTSPLPPGSPRPARAAGAGGAGAGAGAGGAGAKGGDNSDGGEDAQDPDAELAAMVRGDEEDWFEKIQRKEEEERQRKEEQERAEKKAAEQRERDTRDEELRRRRKEGDDARRQELEAARAKKQAERREQSEKGLEDRARAHEAEMQQILLQAGLAGGAEPSKAVAEREARKERIAKLVSKVRGVSIDSEGSPITPTTAPTAVIAE